MAAACAALVLVLLSDKAKQAFREVNPALSDTADPSPETKSGDVPHELLSAWVHFLKEDVLDAVNALNNRLNVILHTVTEVNPDDYTPEVSQALACIRSEGQRAAKITTGLMSRVDALAPDSMPPVISEFDASQLRPGRILLIEDDEGNRTVVGRLLRRLGQDVTVVTNGVEAFTELESAEVDCIISDVKSPYLNGRTLFEQVEQQLPHLASRFLFVTGDFTNPATIDFLENTGQPYIGKPYELEALLGGIAAILRKRR